MTTIPINGGTKTAMIDKVEDKVLQVTSISEVEETHLSPDKSKWLMVTSKAFKN